MAYGWNDGIQIIQYCGLNWLHKFVLKQLRSRLVKSGGEDLKLWLSNHLLTFSPKHRATAASLLETPEMGRWCLPTVEEDSDFLRNKIINEVCVIFINASFNAFPLSF